MKKVIVRLENFCKSYENKEVIKDINLEVYEGEFLTLLGSSGCGKTTILRAISGLDPVTSGKIYINDVDVTNLDPQEREVNTIFQNYALFPLMTIEDNIGFGLKMKKVPKEEIKKSVKVMMELVHLEGYEKRFPSELSGGEQQRVSIVRGLINNPKVLLLDEPLSALDMKLRKQMQIELKQLQRKFGITFIYVTHSQDEALSMSDRIVVLNKGKIEQIGTPTQVYEKPKNLFVANFLGDSNIFKGKVIDDGTAIKTDEEVVLKIDKDSKNVDDEVYIMVRPENIRVSFEKPKGNHVFGKVYEKSYNGSMTKILTKVGKKVMTVMVFGNDCPFKRGDEVYLSWDIEDQIYVNGDSNEK